MNTQSGSGVAHWLSKNERSQNKTWASTTGLLFPSGPDIKPVQQYKKFLVKLRLWVKKDSQFWVGRTRIKCSNKDWATLKGRILQVTEFNDTVES